MIRNIYPESVEESGNYLRLSLKNISDNKLPYNPISYLLWYDYATGRNAPLSDAVNLIFENKEMIDYDLVVDLFKKHIADTQLLLAEKKTKEFQKILIEVVSHLNKSGEKITSQGDMLGALVADLIEAISDDAVHNIAESIIRETKLLIESTKTLSGKLASTSSEIQLLREELEGIKQAAKIDILTGLLNRRGFEEAVEQALKNAAADGYDLCLVMLDIDHFKNINDSYGHIVGDNVLKMVGKLLTENIKGKDIAARFGGEEFVLVLPGTRIDGAYSLSEQIRMTLCKMNWKVKDTGKPIGQITISSGISQFENGDTLETLLKKADDRMYKAKKSGKNRTVMH